MKKLIALVLIFLCVTFLCSCEKMSVEETTHEMLGCILSGDYENLKNYADGFVWTAPGLPQAVEDALTGFSEWEILSVNKTDSKNAEVTVRFYNLDAKKIMADAQGEIIFLGFDEKNINSSYHSAAVAEIYSGAVAENYENLVNYEQTLSFSRIGGNWVCILGEEKTAELMNAILGGYAH